MRIRPAARNGRGNNVGLFVLAMVLLLTLVRHETANAWDPFASEPAQPEEPGDPQADRWMPEGGIYQVTVVYLGDVVLASGPLTIYTTRTIHDSPGTYARVLGPVGTGVPSAYDALALNGRSTLSDGRAVAGTFYESFTLADDGLRSLGVLFFQDDRELARTGAGGAQRAVSDDERRSAGSAPPPGGNSLRPRDPPPIRAGVSLGPLGDPLGRIEPLRGRAVDLWPRAWVAGVLVAVLEWRVQPGTFVALGPVSGTGDLPFRARWDEVPRPGHSWPLRMELTVDVDGSPVTALAELGVAVRAPALVE